jgi:hypothetical protein
MMRDEERAALRAESEREASKLLRLAMDAAGLSCESLAFFVGSSKSRIERAQSLTHPDTLPLRDLMSAPRALQLVVLQHLASKLGLALVELPAATDLSSSLELAAKAQQESGEAVASLLRGLADGHLTRDEGAELAREAREAVSANLALEQVGLAAMREGVIGLRVVGGTR